MRLPGDSTSRRWLCAALLLLIPAAMVQQHVEKRRMEANLTWADPDKPALEAGFLALGGFRGILADMLWIRAIRNQDAARYYELKLLCDMILKLQPTFTQVHAFQAYNMSYNLAVKVDEPEDKWYWVRSGITTLEKGLERNYRNYSLWFELGYQYFDRLGDVRMGDCRTVRDRELPNFDDLTDAERRAVFLRETERRARWAREGLTPQRPRPYENLRYAAYYFWQAMATGTDPTPLRTERVFGACIERLGHWRAKYPLEELRKLLREGKCGWDDWGAEEWWVELRQRNLERGMGDDQTVPTNLKFCLYQQMDFYMQRVEAARAAGNPMQVGLNETAARDAHSRFLRYFPDDQKSLQELLTRYRTYRAGQRRDTLQSLPPELLH